MITGLEKVNILYLINENCWFDAVDIGGPTVQQSPTFLMVSSKHPTLVRLKFIALLRREVKFVLFNQYILI